MANRWGNNGNSDILFSWAPKSLQMVTAAMKLKRRLPLGRKTMTNICNILKNKDTAAWRKIYDQPRQHIKKKKYYFANKGPSSQSCGFSSSHVWMGGLDHQEN